MSKRICLLLTVLLATRCFSDEMPAEVKRLTYLRDKKIEEIDDAYFRQLVELRNQYAADNNHEAVTYVENMLIHGKQKKVAPPVEDLILLAKDATLDGEIIRFEPELGCIGFWTHSRDTLSFDVPSLAAGRYRIIIKHANMGHRDVELLIKVNNKNYKQKFDNTYGWSNTREKNIGYYEHDGKALTVKLSISKQDVKNASAVNIYSVTFTRE